MENELKVSQREDRTDYRLIEQFIDYLLSLSPTELTTFYCETCHDRLAKETECRPTNPFYENSGRCTNCNRGEEVSNPYINQFLNERGLRLEGNNVSSGDFWIAFDETDDVLRDWLIPYGYGTSQSNGIFDEEGALFSWVKYGRTKEKNAYKELNHRLHAPSKALLSHFYPLCYSAERFASAPIVELAKEPKRARLASACVVDEKEAVETEPEFVEVASVVHDESEQVPAPAQPLSTIKRIGSFLASIF